MIVHHSKFQKLCFKLSFCLSVVSKIQWFVIYFNTAAISVGYRNVSSGNMVSWIQSKDGHQKLKSATLLNSLNISPANIW